MPELHSAFPKIFHVGTPPVQGIFEGDVEISEKIDGSAVSVSRIDGEVLARSKKQQIHLSQPHGMFAQAAGAIKSFADKIPEGMAFYMEYLNRPKHNILKYERIPKKHLALYGVIDLQKQEMAAATPGILQYYADLLGIDAVPILYTGKVTSTIQLDEILETDSYLGGQKIEGVVIKRYEPFEFKGMRLPLMAAKYVSERFKEVAKNKSTGKLNRQAKWEKFKEAYRTEARWEKAIQHLREQGVLENEPRDIGLLVKEIQRDIDEEEGDIIREYLYSEFGKELLKHSVKGFADFYKQKLLHIGLEEELSANA